MNNAYIIDKNAYDIKTSTPLTFKQSDFFFKKNADFWIDI